jgi:hypothetical protein
MAKKHSPKPQSKAAKQKKGRKPAEAPEVHAPTRTEPPKKTSALDAAAKVLAEAGEAMTTKAMIEAMAAKGYWTSPSGATPAATLYSAILRELTTKGAQARFVKTDRGKFSLRSQQ